MLRLLVVALILFIIWQLISRKVTQLKSQASKSTDTKKTVKCQYCETFIPESNAVQLDGKYFCDQQHLRSWQEQTSDE